MILHNMVNFIIILLINVLSQSKWNIYHYLDVLIILKIIIILFKFLIILSKIYVNNYVFIINKCIKLMVLLLKDRNV